MTFREDERLVLAAIEATAGTDENPTITDVIRTTGAEITPMEADTQDLAIDQAVVGNQITKLNNKRTPITLPAYLCGGGAAGSIPTGLGTLLRMAAMSETVAAGTSVTYTPVSGGYEGASLYFYRGDALHKSLDCKGSLAFEFAGGAQPTMTLTGQGGFAVPTQATPAVPDFSALEDPLEVNADNTTLLIDGVAVDMQSFSFNGNRPQQFVSRTEFTGTRYDNANPNGTVRFTAPSLASKNWFAAADDSSGVTLVPISLVHGTSAGNIVELVMPSVQLLAPTYAGDSGDLMLEIPFNPIPDNSGIDWQLIFR